MKVVTWIYFIGFISTWLAVQANDYIMKDVTPPKQVTKVQYADQLKAYWTAEKFASAKNLDNVLANVTGKPSGTAPPAPNAPQTLIQGSLPDSKSPSPQLLPGGGRQAYTTGRIFWTIGSIRYSCSGSIVTSSTGDLIVTAAQCLYSTSSRTWLNGFNWVFVPGFVYNAAPYGIWPVRRMLVSTRWTTAADYNYDVGFVALYTVGGWRIQNYLGSQGIAFNYPRLALTYSVGYALNLNNGYTMQECSGYAQRSRWTANGFIGQGLSCTMGAGSAGSPWLQNTVVSTGIGYVTSVTSFTITNVPNVVNGPYFDSNIFNLYNTAATM